MDSSPAELNAGTFEQDWEQADTPLKEAFLERAADLPPSEGILIVLAGLNYHHYSIRNLARESLNQLKERLAEMLEDSDATNFLDALKESVLFASKIYSEINMDAALGDLSFYFKTLLEAGGQGPLFAFKLLYKGDLSTVVLKKIITMVPDAGKLAFVDQYIQTKPSIRIKYGFEFKNILRSVKARKAVVSFYAYLFDMKRDADPFLHNLNASLRDPEVLIANELISRQPLLRIKSIKALSMLSARVDSKILIQILNHEPEASVRIAVYNIIEDASQGAYQDLQNILTQSVYSRERHEALCAFRALVVSAADPLHLIIQNIRKNRSELLPDIIREISTLSRISFFFIQDMANHKEQYLYHHFDINMGCILGIIKKRPERIVRIFKNYDDNSKDSLRMEIMDFIEKTKELLSREKQDIETEFEQFIQAGHLKRNAKPPSKFNLKKVFSKKTRQELVFDQEILDRQDLSGQEFYSDPVYFNQRLIRRSNLSSTRFYNAYFRETLFVNVDLKDARFSSVCFDSAVFINVKAQGAVFEDCSFQNAKIHNCNFDNAYLIDACFAASTLSKTSFINTDFSFAVFSHARISAVSFVNSNLNQADFTGVKARFCRFPSSSDDIYRSDYIDYNSRRFQMEITDLPELNPDLAEEINMLIFMEFIHYGEQKFLKQNKLSLLTCFDIFKPKQADLFEIMPLLIHENIDFPGSGRIDPRTPNGITQYLPSIETQKRAARYLGKDAIIVRRNIQSFIEGMFTIGSTGSLAQTINSDIDYWICIYEESFTPTEIKLLEKKLLLLEAYAQNEFNTKVTFFIVDIVKAKLNDFGGSTIESSGSAQSRILKEEFYRTMIYVAGKIPLWSVLPNSISVNYYDKILKKISAEKRTPRYIDLGDIHAISSKEYFGASIWQMFKWLQSPFKSVLKMALLEKYLYEYGTRPLLCNQYKDEWMNSGAHLRLAQNDSYIILLENLLDYFASTTDLISKNVILTCFFLKLGISKDADIENTVFGLRKILLRRCMEKWNWDKQKIFEIGSFKQWEYRNIARLSSTIKQYMVKKYKTVNQTIDRQSQESSSISPEDKTILSRKIFIEFSKQPGKVGKELLVTRSDSYFQGLYLNYVPQTSDPGYWELKNRSTRGKEEFLIQAMTIEEIGAWLINNKLFSKTSMVNMAPNATYVTFNDIKKLYLALYDFFYPVISEDKSFDVLLKPKVIQHMFISVNFYSEQSEDKVKHYTAITYNSWGEMFCFTGGKKEGFESIDAFKADLQQRIGVNRLPKNSQYYFSKRFIRS